MKIVTANEEESFLDLIIEIKKEIAMLKKHHKQTYGTDKENTLMFHDSLPNDCS